ncbi:MAG: hypothetical protein NT121_23430 [Chloroflexi bacterium]|nr:hypothetical protein [Chloroflexota bacterium]
MFKKMFYLTVLVALVAALLPGAAFADQIKVKEFAQVDKYALVSAQPMTLQFKGWIGCDKAVISGSVNGKNLYVNILDAKTVGGGKPCDDLRNRAFTKQISFGTLVPGNYTVYVNVDEYGKPQKKFKLVAPMLPTPTASTPAKP